MSLSKLINKVWRWRWVLRSLPQTVYFNFHYLPFCQALRLPIFLYKPQLKKMAGCIKIEGKIKTGRIILGQNLVSLYPNNGFVYENSGGTIVFNGTCNIGNSSAISIGPNGLLSLGNGFCASASLKLACYKNITFSDRVRLGWDVTIFDTDFHKLTLLDGGYTNPCRDIMIGENCWLGYGCTVLKGTELPPYTTVSAKTVLNKRYEIPEYCVIGMDNIVKVKKEGIYRNLDDDLI